MKVIIKNFRCWDKKILNFEKGKILLIKGKSGVGKTTLFESIYWCLYGKLRQVEPISKPNSKTSVEIILPWIKIIRSKKPNRIFVYISNQEYQGKSAEEVIINEFGDINQWLSSCYIEQGKQNHFMNLNSQNKLELLNKFSFHNISPEEILLQINKDKICLQEKCKESQTKYEYNFKFFPKEEFNSNLILNDKDHKFYEDELYNINKEIKKLKEDKEIYFKTKNKLENEKERLIQIQNEIIEPINLPDWVYNIDDQINEMKLYKDKIKDLEFYGKHKPFIKKRYPFYNEEEISLIKENERKYQYKLKILKLLRIDENDIEKSIKKLNKIISKKEINFQIEKKRNLIQKLNKYEEELNKLNNFKSKTELSIDYPKEIYEIDDKINIIEDKIKNSLICPECDSNLIYKNDKLIKLSV